MLDRASVGPMHVLAMAVCAAAFAFDLFEMALGSALAAVFSAEPHKLATAQLSWLLASVYIGAVVGAPLFGWMADRYGRKQLMAALMAGLALSSAAAGASEDAAELTVWRGLSGLALGAYPALMISYLTDLLPARRRGPLIFLVVGLASLGAPAGVLLIRGLATVEPLGIEAWRWGFYTGAAGAAAVSALLFLLPESPRWLAARGRLVEAQSAVQRFTRGLVAHPTFDPANAASKPAPVKRAWMSVALLFFASPWSTVAFPLLAGALLVNRGFHLSDTLLYVAVSNFGPALGVLLGALGVDRLERRVTLALCASAMLVASAGFMVAESPAVLILCSTGFMLAAALYVPSLSVYGAELFPTQSRAAAFGGAWTFNRAGAAVAPLLLLPLLQSAGATALMAVVAVSLLVSLALLWLAPTGAAKRPVD